MRNSVRLPNCGSNNFDSDNDDDDGNNDRYNHINDVFFIFTFFDNIDVANDSNFVAKRTRANPSFAL